jgi:hypothetical protein
MEPDKLAVIVDGEVAIIGPLNMMSEKVRAALLSNPIFVATADEVFEGDIWDGASFSRPEK